MKIFTGGWMHSPEYQFWFVNGGISGLSTSGTRSWCSQSCSMPHVHSTRARQGAAPCTTPMGDAHSLGPCLLPGSCDVEEISFNTELALHPFHLLLLMLPPAAPCSLKLFKMYLFSFYFVKRSLVRQNTLNISSFSCGVCSDVPLPLC